MTMIDINAVGFENIFELVDEGGSCSFDTENIIDFRDVIAVGFVGVDFWMGEACS